MSDSEIITATFFTSGAATAAVDWFLNQAIDRGAVTVAVYRSGETPRPPRSGDNRRTDLTWVVSVDLRRARLRKPLVIETMKREGGTVSKRAQPAAR
jgi:hypothetical protein